MRSRKTDDWGTLDEMVIIADEVLYGDYSAVPESVPERLRNALCNVHPDKEAILWCEAQALLAECEDRVADAISWREREIGLISCLHDCFADGSSPPEVVAFALRRRGPEKLSEKTEILRALRSDSRYRRIEKRPGSNSQRQTAPSDVERRA